MSSRLPTGTLSVGCSGARRAVVLSSEYVGSTGPQRHTRKEVQGQRLKEVLEAQA